MNIKKETLKSKNFGFLNKKTKKEKLSLFFKHFDSDFKKEKMWFLNEKNKNSFYFLKLIKEQNKKKKESFNLKKEKEKKLVSDNKNENK